jgi:hypothetical protein
MVDVAEVPGATEAGVVAESVNVPEPEVAPVTVTVVAPISVE